MSKIICGILLAVAFVYAVYLVVTRRNLAKIKDSLKGKNAFTLATLICCAMIMFAFSGKDEKRNVLCYEDVASAQTEIKLTNMLKSAWLVLDYNKSKEFKKSLDLAMENELLNRNVVNILSFTYNETARYIVDKNGLMTCYNLTQYAGIEIRSSQKILEQLEFLNKMKNEGKLGPEIIQKIETSIAYEIETLKEYKDLSLEKDFEALDARYKNKQIEPENDVIKATGIIVEIEKTREKWDLRNESKQKTN